MRNPWLDFASYQYSDRNRFKGREEDIAKFNLIMANGTMSVLYADSGIGKTSFINAGIDPIFIDKGYFPIHILFNEDTFNSNIDVEKWLISDIESKFYEVINVNDSGKEIKQQIKDWHYLYSDEYTEINKLFNSLWWRLHAYKIKDINNGITLKPLLVFDQFEEVFIKGKKDFLSSLFSIIEEASSSTLPVPVSNALDELEEFEDLEIERQPDFKILFSLRKDFLSDFDYWCNDKYSITELFQNRMLLNALSRKQAKQVICDQEGIDTLDEVANEIIEKIDDKHHDAVEPFILSVFCSRLYEKAISINKEILKKEDLAQIDIKNIIRSFYEEKIFTLIPKEVHRFTFETTLVDEDGFRKRERIASRNLARIGFEKTYAKPLEDSHLIRIITINDAKCVEIVHDRIAEVISERNKQRESEKQAAREKAEAERKQKEIEEKAAKEREEAQKEKQKAIKTRNISIASILFLIIVISAGIYLWNWYYHASVSEYYSAYRLRNGWPIGIGNELSENEIRDYSVVYELRKEGHGTNHFTSVFIRNLHDSLTVSRLGTPLVSYEDIYDLDENARAFAGLLSKVKTINFEQSATNDSIASKQVYLDIHNHPLFSCSYEQGGENNNLWYIYHHADGRPMRIRGEADRMRVVRNENGYDVKYQFYSSSGKPCTNKFNWCYGVQYDLRLNDVTYLDAFGDPCGTMSQKANGTILTEIYKNCNALGYDKRLLRYNKSHDIESIEYYKNDALCCNQQNPAKVSFKYDKGRLLEEHYFDVNGNPVSSDDDEENKINGYYSSCYYSYRDDTSEMIGYTYKDADKNGIEYVHDSYKRSNERIITQEYEEELFVLLTNTQMLKAGKMISSIYEVNNQPVMHPKYHYYKSIINYIDEKINNVLCTKVTTKYYDTNNELCETKEYNAEFAIKEEWKDRKGNIIRKRLRDKEENIVKSMEYNYRDGALFEQYVVGIEGKPIRCPEWDIDGLNYYKLRISRDFDDNISRLKPISETGLSSLVYAGFDGHEWAIEIKRDDLNKKVIDDGSWTLIEKPLYILIKEVDKVQNRDVYRVNYVHVLNENALKAGLHDGDVIMGIPIVNKTTDVKSLLKNSNIKIKRCESGIWHSIPVSSLTPNLLKENDCEVYSVFLTFQEYTLLK